MSSLFSFCCLIIALLVAIPGEGVTLRGRTAHQNGNIILATVHEEDNLSRESPMDMVSGKARDEAMHQFHKTVHRRRLSLPNERQSDSDDTEDGEEAKANDEVSTNAHQDKSKSTDTEHGKGATSRDSDEKESISSETVSPLDSMFIEIRKPGLGSPLTETVFKDGALTGLFKSCVIDPAAPIIEGNSDTCYVDDPYNDRVSFRLTFRFPAAELESLFATHPPSLDVIGDSSDIAEPSFLTQEINKESSTGEVAVAYGCKSTSSGTIALQMTLHFGEGKKNSTTIRWKKDCLNQRNDKIEFGYLLNEKGSSDLTRQPFPSEESPLVVVPNDVSTEVFMKLEQAGAQQEFFAPYVTSSNPDVTSVSVRGNHPSGGVLQGLEQTTLQVNYDCATKGVSDISLSVGIPPFENLTATWKKDCGGRPATSLQVGTSEDSHDIVENGKPTPRYMVAIESIGTAHSDEHLHLPGNQSDWTVYILNSEGGSSSPAASEAALHVGRITLTVEHPETVVALAPKVSSRRTTGWSEQIAAEHIVAPGESLKVSFHFLCRAIGESRILITVPMLQYDALEFGLAKECTHIGTARKARELVWTVGTVFRTGVFVLLLLILAWWWRRRRVTGKGFEALPVTER